MPCRIQHRYIFSCWWILTVISAGFFPGPMFSAIATPENGALADKPVVGRNANGVLEIFQVDAEGRLRHRWQNAINGDWVPWMVMGTGFLPGMAAATDASGRMEVFAVNRTSHTLCCARQAAVNSQRWSPWTNLGGLIRPPLTVACDGNGKLEVFALNATNSTVTRLCQTNPDGGWSPWINLGGSVEPDIVVEKNDDGRLELFGIDAGGAALVHCWQQEPGTGGEWSPWTSLGGSISPGFAVTRTAGLLEVFAVTRTNGEVNCIHESRPSSSRDWTPWIHFGEKMKPGLAVGKTGNGRLEVFGVDARTSVLFHRWESLRMGSGDWSPWTSMEETVRSYPAVEDNEDGDLEVFAQDLKRRDIIRHCRQISSASGWLDWSTLNHQTLPRYSHLWQVSDGLPDDKVQAIAQTTDGYLWVGTHNGLARFDGMEFATFDTNNAPALKNSNINALCAGRDGSLWIGTDSGLARMRNGVFVSCSRPEVLAGGKIHAIFQSKDGPVWIGTDAGLFHYSDGRFTQYTQTNGLWSNIVRSIYEDRQNNLWIATERGLNQLTPDGKMNSFAIPCLPANDTVDVICQDRGGQIWLGSDNGMLWYNRAIGKGFYPYNLRYGLSDPFVTAISEDREGNLWVGTYNGLNRFWQGRFYSQVDGEGMPFDKVNTLFGDRQGNLWVGTQEGLTRLAVKPFVTYTRRQGLTDNNVTAVLQDQAGNFWIATYGGGLDELTGGDQVKSYTATNNLSQNLVLSLCEGRDGSIWAGSDLDGGLTRWKNGVETRYIWRDGLPDAGVQALFEDHDGNLWVGTSHGLSRLRAGTFTHYGIGDHLAGNNVRAICEDRTGGVWFGTDGGLSRWKDGTFVTFTTNNGLSDNSIMALCEDSQSNLWIGTRTGGMDRFRDGRFTSYSAQDGLFSDEIFSILEDNSGWLWMTCSRGIFRVRKADLDQFDLGKIHSIHCIAYNKADGLESAQCNGVGRPASWRDRRGRLWFPTTKGLVMVDPATVQMNPLPPTVRIDGVIMDRKPLLNAAQNTPGAALRIPPARGELQFQYSALNLSAPEKSRFKYKLDGIDSRWVDAGTRQTAYYNNIPPGHYHFHVIACNQDGVWNRSGAVLAFILLPHFWQTWWFQTLVALLAIGCACALALYLTRRRMQRKVELLKHRHAMEKERGRIARDIHDELGSSLTRIMMLGERTEEGMSKNEDIGVHVQKIVTSARRTIQALDEIVWAVNPENDTLDGLAGYIGHYSHEFFEETKIRCRLEMPVDLPPISLSAEVRHNLFLLIKEAFNNVLKHSGASEVRVRLALAGPALQVEIEDNGCGFALNGAVPNGRRGNGLENIRKRTEELNGQFRLHSAADRGTRLQFTVNLETIRNGH